MAPKEEYLKNVSENEIMALFKNYVPAENYSEFINANKEEFVKIKYGKPSKVFELSNFKTGVKYYARINGVKKISTQLNSFTVLSCFYKLPKLQLAKDISIGNYKYSFTENELTELKETRRLNKKITLYNDSKESIERFVAIDDELNRVAFVPVKSFKAPSIIKNTELTAEQRIQLENGEKIDFIYKRNVEDSFQIKTQIYFDPVTTNIQFSNPQKITDQKIEMFDLSISQHKDIKIESGIEKDPIVKKIDKIEKSEFTKKNQTEKAEKAEKAGKKPKQQTMKL